MENAIKIALGTKTFCSEGSGGGGGSISTGSAYKTDNGIVFIKVNQKEMANLMFEGEMAGLNAIFETKTIRVPKPLAVVPLPAGETKGSCAFVMEYVQFSSASSSTVQEKLGEQLASLHLYNENQRRKAKKDESRVTSSSRNKEISTTDQFGFHIPTSCGYLSLDNSWNADWTTFYIRQRLQPQVDRIVSEHGNKDLIEAWNKCRPIIEGMLNKINHLVTPSLLHGDLWSGNFGAYNNESFIFDPAAFYGHHEFDLGIGYMFGGFRKPFHDSYHRIIPKTEGFSERQNIYELFHHLNHWNHFGNSYKGSTLQIMKSIVAANS